VLSLQYNIACRIVMLSGPYFCNTQLQYFFLVRFSHNNTVYHYLLSALSFRKQKSAGRHV